MERQLNDLNMRRARFEVQIIQRPDPDGVPATPESGSRKSQSEAKQRYAFSVSGIDRIEFLLSPNPGEPLKPLVRIASGGETSRLMLALKTILAEADIVPTLIFDEIDAGISGKSGQIVGEKLWQLGRSHQVLCVTHLPQIAALGDAHYRVAKLVERDHTLTTVEQLDHDAQMLELSQMLGGTSTTASRTNAADLLDRSRGWKAESRAARSGA
jgi:DNA repair protein RecN (Recombination protein N)